MAYPEDPDFSSVDALPDPSAAPKLSTELDTLATAIQTTATGIGTDAGGRTPDDVVAAASAAANATRDAATNAATVEAAIKLLKDAVAAWKKDAPKKKELDTAEKAVEDAKTAVAAAQKTYDEATTDAAKTLASTAVNTANTSLLKAIKDLAALKAKRKSADEAYERERAKAAAKMKTLKGGNWTPHGGGTGKEVPGTGAASSTGTDTQSTGTGSPAAKPAGTPSGTPKPTTGTPAAQTPTTGKPSDTTGKGADAETAALAAALAGQQQNQQPQTQQAATTPQASTPQQAQQPQSDKDKEKGKDDPNGKTTGAIDVDDLIREGALPASAAAATLTGVGGGNPISTLAPVASTPSTTFRPAGTPISGVGLGGAPAVNQQAPATSGTSATGLHTASDVSGRSTPAASAFSPTPAGAETKTSGATGNAAQQGTPLTQRGAGSGMPAMPMSPMMGGTAPTAGGTGKGSDGADPSKILRRLSEEQKLLTGQDTLGEAVRGGTIAQNRPESGAA